VKAFVVCPLTKYVGETGEREVDDSYRRFVEGLHDLLARACGEVFAAVREEGWGERLLPPAIRAARDFEELRSADVVVAWPEDSCGCALELGWASALGKPVVLILDGAVPPPTPLLLGLHALPGEGYVRELRLPPGSVDERLRLLADLLPPLVGSSVLQTTEAP
jgi:hypothetical protein